MGELADPDDDSELSWSIRLVKRPAKKAGAH